MFNQARPLSSIQRDAVAEFISGKKLGSGKLEDEPAPSSFCAGAPATIGRAANMPGTPHPRGELVARWVAARMICLKARLAQGTAGEAPVEAPDIAGASMLFSSRKSLSKPVPFV